MGSFPADRNILLRCWKPPTRKQESFYSKQETVSPSPITPAEWESRALSVGTYSFLDFSRKPLTEIWAGFWACGPQVPICSGQDFTGTMDRHLQRNMWIHHGYFCSPEVGKVPSGELSAIVALGYLKLDDSLCVTSSCFPPLGPSHLRGLAWARRVMKPKLLLRAALLCWGPFLLLLLYPLPGRTHPSLCAPNLFVPSLTVVYASCILSTCLDTGWLLLQREGHWNQA